jgi:hypothetical protein
LPVEPTIIPSLPATDPSPETEQNETTDNVTENLCLHPLWPLQNGASWTYQLTDTAGAPQSQLTLEAAVGEGRVILTMEGHSSALTCGDGSLNGLPPLPVGHPDLGYYAGGENPQGPFLPEPGLLMPLGTPATWDMEIRPTGTIWLPQDGESQQVSILDGRLVIFNQSSSLEPVSVPAGSFPSLAVTQNVFFEIRVALPDGAEQSVLINTQVQVYYAEGIGLVKILYQGGTISMPESAWTLPTGPTLELASFAMPAE